MAVYFNNGDDPCSRYSLVRLKHDSPVPPINGSYAGSLPVKPSRPRLIRRDNGRSQLRRPGVSRQGFSLKVKDGFTTLIDARWHWILLIFCTVYVLSWLTFAVAWFVAEKVKNHYKASCVERGNTFSAMLLFSIETQVTIGYGAKSVRSDCYAGIPLLMIQCLVGLFLDSFLMGLVYAKIVRPRQRRKSILFSDKAVVHEMNGKRALEVRIHNLRRSQLVEAHVRLYLYWYVENGDKECELCCYDLDVGYTTGRDRVLFIVPVTVTHYIDESSPLYLLDSESILDQDLEIVVALEASVESTGLTAQALWSYTSSEILIGHRFEQMISRDANTSEWIIDVSKISKTIRVKH